MSSTLPDFDSLYTADPDPWEVATSWYERRKIGVVLACLRRERYGVVWDAACGTGELTAHLATRADAVLASDSSAQACELARARCAPARGVAGVTVVESAVPQLPALLPSGGADLVVLSEFLYYLPAEVRAATPAAIERACAPGADVVAVHWSARPEGALVPGVEAHRDLDRALLERGWGRLLAHRDVEFLLTMWSRDVPEMIGR